jgi:endonuclease/exonuclease/phosphatase family metal-dependent hydrolase
MGTTPLPAPDARVRSGSHLAQIGADSRAPGELAERALHVVAAGLPRKESIKVATWNLTASFFDGRDLSSDGRHKWLTRQNAIQQTIERQSPDVLGLQVSPQQALWINAAIPGYSTLFFSQTPSEVETLGIITAAEVATWKKAENPETWKDMGTPLTGIMVKEGWQISEGGGFWLKPEPNQRPVGIDKTRQLDKGFGNTASYRAVMWVKLKDLETGKVLFVFNSHYPLSGDRDTRRNCAAVERAQIDAITRGADWVSVGDRNILPRNDGKDGIWEGDLESLAPLLDRAFDSARAQNHKGQNTTWAGFDYDAWKNPVTNERFERNTVLDVIASNKPAAKSKYVLTQFNPATGEVSLNPAQVDPERHFGSDHLYVQAKYSL